MPGCCSRRLDGAGEPGSLAAAGRGGRDRRGEPLAETVVGATGSGKTALLDLLPRLYDPQHGTILLDGVSIGNLPLADLRLALACVPQETVLFSETIAANVGYANQDEDSWRAAAGIAQLEATIEGFPGGNETLLGERGINSPVDRSRGWR